ncbi:MAG: tetratricopeptide repeat protein, partial [Planctomycetota bacterium]|nr:tetratricopeptide repeat protein [Planctomycetota bacterium]
STTSEPIRAQVIEADRAARANPSSAAIVGDLGVVYHASLFNQQALHAYALATTLDPEAWRPAYYRGLLLEERGEHEPALQAFLQVTSVAPAQGHAWFHIAEIRFKRRELDAAVEGYRRVRESPATAAAPVGGVTRRVAVPLAAFGDLGLVRVLLERGARDQAKTEIEQLVRAQPNFGPARDLQEQLVGRADRVSHHDGDGSYLPPVDPLMDAVVARSQQPDLLLKHAALAGRAGDAPWREFLARRALAVSPRGLDVLLEMSSMLQAAGRHTEALEFLRQAEAVAPGDHHTLVEEGKTLSELGRLEEAEQVLRRAIRVRDAAAEYNLGTVLDRQERWDEARSHYERALSINPFHTRALNNLGVGLDRRGQTPAALALYARALDIAPADPEVLSNLGSAFLGKRRYAEAIAVLDRAVTIDPAAPNAHNNLGIALAQSGRLDEAVARFQEALRLNPRHANARRNLEAIKKLGK